MTRRRKRSPKPRHGFQGIERLNMIVELCVRAEDTPYYREAWEELKDEILATSEPETVAAWWVFEKGETPPPVPDPREALL
jgi:hypothetical protein